MADTRDAPQWLVNLQEMVGAQRGDKTRVAKAAKMPLQQLQTILDGNNLKPQIDTLERIAQACGRELSEVFTRPDKDTGHALRDRGEGSKTGVEDHLAALISHFGKLRDQKARTDLVTAITSLFAALEHSRTVAVNGAAENDGR